MPLIEANQFRSIYGRLADGRQDDDLVTLIDAADAFMATYCGFPVNNAGSVSLATAEYTLYYGRPSRQPAVLCLGVFPVLSVSDVRVDAARAYGTDTQLVEGTDFDVDNPCGKLGLLPGGSLGVWPVAWRAVRVTFTAGYDPTPPDLLPLTAFVIQALLDRPSFQQQAASAIGGSSITTTDLDQILPAAVRAALDAGYSLKGC